MKKLTCFVSFLFIITVTFSQDLLMQNGTFSQCTGTFYDSGGPTGNYGNNEDFTITICPDSAGNLSRVDFSGATFLTQMNNDELEIYNGDDTSAPSFGRFSGSNNPGIVTATTANASGCLTFVFISDVTARNTGWQAAISCVEPCQVINSQIDSAMPVPNADGYIRVCTGQEISLEGSGTFSRDGSGASYQWDLGDGNTINGQTAVFSYATPGVYFVNLNIRDTNTSVDPMGCTNRNLINQVIQVGTAPNFRGTRAADSILCFGDSTTIDGVVTPVEFRDDCTPPVSGITFLPDGSGVSYETAVTVTCYDSATTLTDINQLTSICLNMEHSFLGDLDIDIISPNGQIVRLHDSRGGSANLGEPWATDTVDTSTSTTPGVGYDYCFLPNTTNPTLFGGIQDGGTFIRGNGPGTYLDRFVPAGSYSSVQNLAGLLGSPLNGNWTIRVTDNVSNDNGHIFAWSIAFDPALQPAELSFTPTTVTEDWDADPSITNTTGNTITVTPTTVGDHCYMYRAIDDFGCEYTEQVCIEVLPEIDTAAANDLVLCGAGTPPNIFDLTENDAIINAPAVNPGDQLITYYETQMDAENATNPITNTTSYSSSAIIGTPQAIFIRVESIRDESCFIFTTDPAGAFELVVNPNPEITSLSSNTDICSGDAAVFTINGTATHVVDYTINSGGTQQVTLDAAGQAVITLSAVTANQTITLESVTNPTTTCSVALTNTATVVVNPNPTVGLSSNTTICSGDDAVFTITGNAGNVVDYNINAGGTLQITINAAGQAVITTSGATTDQTITLESVVNPTTSCSSALVNTNTVTVTANPVITSLTTNTDICSGADAIFTINGTANNIIDYAINSGATEQITIDGAGQAVITLPAVTVDQTIELQLISNPTGTCTTMLTDTATIIVLANPTVTLNSNTSICPGEDAMFTIIGASADRVDYNINGGGTLQTTLDATGQSVITITAPTADQVLTIESVTNPTSSCTTVLTLSNTVTINPLPTVIAPTPLEACDDGTPDGSTDIDLSIKNNEISGGNVNYIVTYYNSLSEAEAPTGALPTPYFGSDSEIVYVRVEDSTTGCFNTTTLELLVVQAPVTFAPTAPLEFCDPDSDGFGAFILSDVSNQVSGGDMSLIVTFFETMENSENNVNAITDVPYNNIVADNQTIYIRVESATASTDCASFETLQLIVNPEPQIIPTANLTPLEICDDNTDGFATFDLTSKESEILNLLDADTTNDLDPLDYTISYYQTEVNAEAPTNAIGTPNPYTNTTREMATVWVRVENTTTGCFKIIDLDLIVNPLPVLVQSDPLELCNDNDLPGETAALAQEAFTLEDANAQILAGQNGITLTYFSTQAGATTNDGAEQIFSPYTNTSNAQTVYVRATDNDTGCLSFTTVTIRVLPNPSPNPNPADLELCDTIDIVGPNDLLEVFNLTQREASIINSESGVSASYYLTQANAIAGTNAIADPTQHTNEDPATPGTAVTPQTIYVRITNGTDPAGSAGTGCYSLVSFDIIVNPIPVVTPVADYVICELNTDNEADFDLTTKTDAILNEQDPAIFTVTYHETPGDADTAMNDLAASGNYRNISNPQTIYVNITNTITGCATTALTFELRVDEAALANSDGIPILYEFCDDTMEFDGDTTNDTTVFDLSTQNTLVLDGQDPTNYSVTYYATQADADAGINALPFTYINTANPQIIIARVDNDLMVDDGSGTGTMTDSSICYETAEVTLQVNPMPSFVLEETYIFCINTNGTEIINAPLIDTGLDPALYSFEWRYEDTVLAGETGPSITPTQGGNYSVMVTDTSTSTETMCTGTLSTVVTVSEPPVVTTEVTSLAFADQHEILVTATSTTPSSVAEYEFSIDGSAWELGTLNADGSYSYTFTDVAAGDHIITVRDTAGCGEATATVTIMDYPHYFTPNGDGYHDTWNITAIANQPDAIIYIFDRFGKLLKQLSPTGAGWNGTYNGNLLPTSDYWFTVEYTEPGTTIRKNFKAHFTLKR